MTSPRPDLADIGRVLYGDRWQAPLAAALGLNLRTVQRYAAGDTAPPPGVLADALALAERRGAEIAEMVKWAKRHLTPPPK